MCETSSGFAYDNHGQYDVKKIVPTNGNQCWNYKRTVSILMLERMAKECRVLSHKSAYRSGFEWGSKRKTSRSLSTPALETEAKSKCVKLWNTFVSTAIGPRQNIAGLSRLKHERKRPAGCCKLKRLAAGSRNSPRNGAWIVGKPRSFQPAQLWLFHSGLRLSGTWAQNAETPRLFFYNDL